MQQQVPDSSNIPAVDESVASDGSLRQQIKLRVLVWLEKHHLWSIVIDVSGPVLLALAGIVQVLGLTVPIVGWKIPILPVFVAGAGLTLIMSWIRVAKDASLSTVKNKLAKSELDLATERDQHDSLKLQMDERKDDYDALCQEIEQHASAFLGRAAQANKLGPDERLTVYLSVADGLRAVARYSQNHEYQSIGNETRIKLYPNDHGLIGYVRKTALRKFVTNGPAGDDGYREWQRSKCLLSGHPGDGPRMKSRHYDVVPILNPTGLAPLGVVSLESVSRRCDNLSTMGEEFEDEHSQLATGLRDLLALLGALNLDREEEAGDD